MEHRHWWWRLWDLKLLKRHGSTMWTKEHDDISKVDGDPGYGQLICLIKVLLFRLQIFNHILCERQDLSCHGFKLNNCASVTIAFAQCSREANVPNSQMSLERFLKRRSVRGSKQINQCVICCSSPVHLILLQYLLDSHLLLQLSLFLHLQTLWWHREAHWVQPNLRYCVWQCRWHICHQIGHEWCSSATNCFLDPVGKVSVFPSVKAKSQICPSHSALDSVSTISLLCSLAQKTLLGMTRKSSLFPQANSTKKALMILARHHNSQSWIDHKIKRNLCWFWMDCSIVRSI